MPPENKLLVPTLILESEVVAFSRLFPSRIVSLMQIIIQMTRKYYFTSYASLADYQYLKEMATNFTQPRFKKDIWLAKTLLSKEMIQGIAALPNGDFYFTNPQGLWKWNTRFKTPLNMLEGNFMGIVWDGTNNLFICASNNTIYQFNIETGHRVITNWRREKWDSGIFSPWGIAINGGELFVCENQAIRKINLRQKILQRMLATTQNFSKVTGIAVTTDGDVFVADSNAHCIKMIKGNGAVIVAGSEGQDGYQDGEIQKSKFGNPRALVFDADGTLLVVDDYALRRVDFCKGVVSTVQVSGVMFCVTVDPNRNIYIGTTNGIVMLQNIWKSTRMLWIGKMKEQPTYCNLARLPKEIVSEIAAFVNTPLISQGSNSGVSAPSGCNKRQRTE